MARPLARGKQRADEEAKSARMPILRTRLPNGEPLRKGEKTLSSGIT